MATLGLFLFFECSARLMHDPQNVDFLFNWSFWDTRIRMNWFTQRLNESARIPLTEGGFRGRWTWGPKQKGNCESLSQVQGMVLRTICLKDMPGQSDWKKELQQKGHNAEVWKSFCEWVRR